MRSWAAILLFALIPLPASPAQQKSAPQKPRPVTGAGSASGKFAGPCYRIRGRLSYYNGSPSTRIWIVGTHRLLGVPSEESELPPNVKVLMEDFEATIFGDFVVCPLSPERPGRMQMVVVKSASHVVNLKLLSK